MAPSDCQLYYNYPIKEVIMNPDLKCWREKRRVSLGTRFLFYPKSVIKESPVRKSAERQTATHCSTVITETQWEQKQQ